LPAAESPTGMPLYMRAMATFAAAAAPAGPEAPYGVDTPVPVQAKLAVVPRSDATERQADHVARAAASGACCSGCAARTAWARPGQARPGFVADPAAESMAALPASSSGAPLSASVRRRIEPVLGADLGHVRVHSDSASRDAASAIGARAFTHRNHIYLGPRQS